jgi:probable rRNA maturation factor
VRRPVTPNPAMADDDRPPGRPRRQGRLRVHVADGRGRPIPARALAEWLVRVAPATARGSVGVAVVSDARVRALNRRYRHEDSATDVLSFPSGERRATGRLRRAASGERAAVTHRPPFLGEIVIARGVARRQARAARHSESTELRVLALHGLLHLLGFDHDHERDRGRMRRVERRLRKKGGLREGLIERIRP